MQVDITKWKPQDLIAGLIIVGCFVLKAMGHDDVLSWTLLAVVASYYGIKITPQFRIGRKE